MLVPIFTLKLNQKIFPRLVTVGSYDGKHACLTAATNGGKVFIHTPHQRTSSLTGLSGGVSRVSISSTESDIMLLSFGQHITSLTAGTLDPETNHDVLVIGSQTNIIAYDVERNSELFYKDLPDGANAMLIGKLSNEGEPLALVGGNCAIHGFDCEGQDKFWTVTGDNVCSLALLDYDSDGHNELVVGSEDYEIRVFKEDELLTELSEVDAVISLCPIQKDKFAYSLINGIIGVYGGSDRFWRIKSKSQPMCMHAFDMNDDGLPELVTGWSSGKMDVRSIQTGNIIYKDTFSSHIAGIVQADYRLDGKEELICCSIDGEVRGYLPPSLSDTYTKGRDQSEEYLALEELSKKKQELLLELKNFEVNKQQSESTGSSDYPMGTIPAGTRLKTEFSAYTPDKESSKNGPCAELSIETNNGTILRSVVIFAEGLFEGESHIVHPPANKLGSTLKVPLYPDKDVPIDLSIKAYVGHSSSSQFHVFEVSRPLPRFSLYIPCGLDAEPVPKGSVTFNLNERLDRILAWITDNFMYSPGDDAVTSPNLHIAYMSLRTSTPLVITMHPSENGRTTIMTDDMDLAGDLIQSLASFISIEDLAVVADFPHQLEDMRAVIKQVDELRKVRQQLSAEMADNSGVIGNLVVRAEDARMMKHVGNMKKAYSQLFELNKDIMTGYKIRSSNHIQLLECLKIVNQAIQKAGKLRVGKPKARVVNACRSAIKNNDVEELFRVIRHGT